MTVNQIEVLIEKVTDLVCQALQKRNIVVTAAPVAGTEKVMTGRQGEYAQISDMRDNEQDSLHITYLSCTEMCEIAQWTPQSPIAKAAVKALGQGKVVYVENFEYNATDTLKKYPYRWRRHMQQAFDTCLAFGIRMQPDKKALCQNSSDPGCGEVSQKIQKSVGTKKFLTLATVQNLLAKGEAIPAEARLTPLAADYVRMYNSKK